VTAANLARALASFERVLLTGDTRVDRFRAGRVQALTDRERHGLWLFESRGRCWRCHSGPNFTDEAYHNTGVGWGKAPADPGRHAVTGQEADRGRFKTPTLRGLRSTAPYMHDGSMATLDEVVAFYNRGGGPNQHLDPAIVPLGLSKEDVQDLVAFLEALSEGRD
jgi:cytochrome c peroxidase